MAKKYDTKDLDRKLIKKNKELQLERNFSENLMETASAMVIILDRKGTIKRFNRFAENLTGFKKDDVIGRNWFEMFIPEENRKRLRKLHGSPDQNGDTSISEKRIRIKNGTEKYICWNHTQLDGWENDESFTLSIGLDVSERIEIEADLRMSEEKLMKAQKLAKLGYYVFDIRSGFWTSSEELNSIFGIEDTYQKDVSGWLDIVHPDWRPIMQQYLKDQVLGHGQDFNKEYQIVSQISGEEKWVHGLGFLKFDESGNPIEMFGTIQDITERIKLRNERKRLQEQLSEANKMEAVGILAGGIAHEFNNLLAIIMGYTEMVLDELDGKKTLAIEKNLKKVIHTSQRAKEMVEQLLSYSRKGGMSKKLVDIKKIFRNAIEDIQPKLPPNINLVHSQDDNLNLVYGNANQLMKVILNLASNAIDAIHAKQGTVTINMQQIKIERSKSRLTELNPGDYLKLTVSDDGIGIPENILENIFVPYFTTKEIGQGTGMGLAVVFGIVKSHQGDIQVQSEPGKGTSFDVFIPIV